MSLIEHIKGAAESRRLFSLYVDELAELNEPVTLPEPYFSCLLACDSTNAPDKLILSIADKLLDAGLVYQCTWGPGCSWTHDLFDLAFYSDINRAETSELMTSWHQDETLDHALWFLMYCAFPPTLDLSSVLVITVGNSEWDKQVRDRLSDLEKLNEIVVGKD